MRNKIISYAAVLIFAVLFLYAGNKIAVGTFEIFNPEGSVPTIEARIVKILDISEDINEYWSNKIIRFEARVISGADLKGGVITGVQGISSFDRGAAREINEGDKVILIYDAYDIYDIDEWYFYDYVRINKIIILGVAFIILLVIFGRIQGLNAILALCFTCVAVFAVFIPSILSGKNIYVWAVIVSAYAVIVTLFMVNGINRKSLAAVAGCFGSIGAIALLTLIMDGVLGLTGVLNAESMDLLYVNQEINLRAIIFAGIMIGAVGAVMDVAMSIATALWEIKRRAPDLDFSGFLKSGINMGKDIAGTMANTLVLAYTGGSLSIILLLFVYSNSLAELLNRELIIAELLQAIIGCFGILLTMPLTALICAVLYSRNNNNINGKNIVNREKSIADLLENYDK